LTEFLYLNVKEASLLRSKYLVSLLLFGFFVANAHSASAQQAAHKTKPSSNYTKGQSQLAGGNGEFGVVYSLQDFWNEEILSAKYTLEGFNGSSNLWPTGTEKMFVLNIAIKNAKSSNQWYNARGRYTLVDQTGKQYTSSAAGLASAGEATFEPTLNPGQGLGQLALNDPVRVAFEIDANSKITKIVLNEGRLGHNEKVLRYFLKGATAVEDGGDGDPRNVVAPLPADVQDPSDPSGATALAIGNGGKPGSGTLLQSNFFDFSVDSFGDAPAGTTAGGGLPGNNKKFVQAFITIHNPTPDELDTGWFQADGTQELIDTDGDTYKVDKILKASSDDDTGNRVQPNAFVKFRFVYEVPTNVKLQTLKIGSYNARLWNVDISGS
jgi:hypothetical protein